MAVTTRENRGKAFAGKQDARRLPRQVVSWLVSVSIGSRQLQGRTKDTSAAGAKILVAERLPLGSQVFLQFRPAGRSPVEAHAIVWRLDADGFACLFVGSQGPRFLEAVAPPRGAVAGVRPSEIRRRGTVLLAVMDPGVRELALAALGAHGHTVLDAGPQPLLALRFAQEHVAPIDLLLVDVELQLMNGMTLVERLMAHLPAAKVLLVSAGSAQRPAIPGASWLPAPCAREELASCVQRLLEVETKQARCSGSEP
jgi:CheY-like chemotaxis protein